MEYSLLKLITPPLPYLHSNKFVQLSSTPARDLINPGIGQSIRLYSFYVPLTYNSNPYKITKIDTQELKEQEGFGEIESDKELDNNSNHETIVNDNMTNLTNDKDVEDVLKTDEDQSSNNLLQGKDLDPGIRTSFEFPKITIKKTIMKSKATKPIKKT